MSHWPEIRSDWHQVATCGSLKFSTQIAKLREKLFLKMTHNLQRLMLILPYFVAICHHMLSVRCWQKYLLIILSLVPDTFTYGSTSQRQPFFILKSDSQSIRLVVENFLLFIINLQYTIVVVKYRHILFYHRALSNIQPLLPSSSANKYKPASQTDTQTQTHTQTNTQ